MSTARTVAFVKFCKEEAHADQFISGQLYMRKLRFFQGLENPDKYDGRGDPTEATVTWHQPQNVRLEFAYPGRDPVIIPNSDLAGPVSSTRNFYADMHVFCMTALQVPDPATLGNDHDSVLQKMQTSFQVDERCLDFGAWAVFVPANLFCPLLFKAFDDLKYFQRADLVDYYDETTFHGEFPEEDVPFKKQSKFTYQNEYRVCLQTPHGTTDPWTLNIGNMSSHARKLRSVDLNKSLIVNLNRKN